MLPLPITARGRRGQALWAETGSPRPPSPKVRATRITIPAWTVVALLFFAIMPFVLVWYVVHETEPEPVYPSDDLRSRGLQTIHHLQREYRRLFGAQATEDAHVAVAGLPRYPRVFARDLLLSALLLDEPREMREALKFCMAHQGSDTNALTGEEPGKIFHEFPGIVLRAHLSTEFNSLDSTPLFVITAFRYFQHVADFDLNRQLSQPLRAAVTYIRKHLDGNDLYFESPKLSGANRFSLKVTYWKDSIVWGRPDGSPVYPVTYTLAHAQALCALRFAAALWSDPELDTLASRMVVALKRHLWDETVGTFFVGRDANGPLPGLSSDSLHLLWYLRHDDLDTLWLGKIVSASKDLETSVSFAATRVPSSTTTGGVRGGSSTYHAFTVWPFEQAFIHAAAKQYPPVLKGVASVARRSDIALTTTSTLGEHFRISQDGKVELVGATEMLWTAAAAIYFHHQRNDARDDEKQHTLSLGVRQTTAAVMRHAPAGQWATTVAFLFKVRGVKPDEYALYRSSAANEFVCRDGMQRIPYSSLNDDFCDCLDQSDEPGTSACPKGVFFCDGLVIASHRVDDGIRDCPVTGADESS